MVTNAAYITTDTSGKTALHLIPKGTRGNVFYEKDGYVSVEAMHYTKAVNANGVIWKILPDLGRTDSDIIYILFRNLLHFKTQFRRKPYKRPCRIGSPTERTAAGYSAAWRIRWASGTS